MSITAITESPAERLGPSSVNPRSWETPTARADAALPHHPAGPAPPSVGARPARPESAASPQAPAWASVAHMYSDTQLPGHHTSGPAAGGSDTSHHAASSRPQAAGAAAKPHLALSARLDTNDLSGVGLDMHKWHDSGPLHDQAPPGPGSHSLAGSGGATSGAGGADSHGGSDGGAHAASGGAAAGGGACPPALAPAGTAKETFTQFVDAPATQQAFGFAALGPNVSVAAAKEEALIGQALPELGESLSGSEQRAPPAAAPESLAAHSRIDSQPKGAPPSPAALAKSDPGKAQKPAATSLTADDKGKAQPQQIEQAIRSVPTRDGNIEVTPKPKPQLQLTGSTDPRQNDDRQRTASAEVSSKYQAGLAAVEKLPGPERVQPLKVDLKHRVELAKKSAPALDTVAPPQLTEYVALGLPGGAQTQFDALMKEKTAQSMQSAKAKVSQASEQRDQAKDREVKQSQDKSKQLNQDAQKRQDDTVSKGRDKLTQERGRVEKQFQSEKQRFDTDSKGKLDAAGRGIQDRVQKDQAQMDAAYQSAEKEAAQKVKESEQEAEEKKRKAEQDSKERSWWDQAVDFVKDCLSELADLVTAIFDKCRQLVAAVLDKVKALANSIIDAACDFIQKTIRAFGELLKTLVDELIGKIFPELAQKLKDYIDKGVAESCQAVQQIADELKKKISDLIDGLKAAIDWILSKFQVALTTGISFLKALVSGDWKEMLKVVLEGVLRLLGIDPGAFMSVLAKSADSIGVLVKHPGQFVGNMITAVKDGFHSFGANFLKHLEHGFISWLTGMSAQAGFTMPPVLDSAGMLSLVMQVAGITKENIRQILIKHLGPKRAAMLERIWNEIESFLATGLQGLWTRLQDYLGNLFEEVTFNLKKFLMETVVTAAIEKLAMMFNPVTAIIEAVRTVWKLYTFLRDNISRITGVVRAVTDSINNIASGDTSGASASIEDALVKLIPVAIDLLAKLLNLDGLATRVRKVIQQVQEKVLGALDRMVGKLIEKFSRLFPRKSGAADTSGSPEAHGDDHGPAHPMHAAPNSASAASTTGDHHGGSEGSSAPDSQAGPQEAVDALPPARAAGSMEGEGHTVTADFKTKDIIIASKPMTAAEKLQAALDTFKDLPDTDENKRKAKKELSEINKLVDKLSHFLKSLPKTLNRKSQERTQKEAVSLAERIMKAMTYYGHLFHVHDLADPLPHYPGPEVGRHQLSSHKKTPDGLPRESHHVPNNQLFQTLAKFVGDDGRKLEQDPVFRKYGLHQAGKRLSDLADKLLSDHAGGKGLAAILINRLSHQNVQGKQLPAVHSKSMAPLIERLVELADGPDNQTLFPKTKKNEYSTKPSSGQWESVVEEQRAAHKVDSIYDDRAEQLQSPSKATSEQKMKQQGIALLRTWLDACGLALSKNFEDGLQTGLSAVTGVLGASLVDGSPAEINAALAKLPDLARATWKPLLISFDTVGNLSP